MKGKLALTKRKRLLLASAVICAILVSGLTVWWRTRPVAQAAFLSPSPLGLVGWWSFDEGSGNVAKDSSGYGNDGTIYGATYVDGKYRTALSFDGASNYVEVSANPSLFPSSAITIELWIKIATADIDANAYMGFVCRNTRTGGLQVVKNWGDGRVAFETPGVSILMSTVALTPDVWNHVVCVLVSGSSATIYINGQQQGSSSGWALPTTSMNYWIGRAAQGTTNPYLKGAVDEVHIYNR
jgi:hypothetical protein